MDNKTVASVVIQTKVRQRQSLAQTAQKRTSLNWLGTYRAPQVAVDVVGEDRRGDCNMNGNTRQCRKVAAIVTADRTLQRLWPKNLHRKKRK